MQLWTANLLSDIVRTKLDGHRLIVVSNREPFMHCRAGGRIECRQPASGMACALDPIMRACGGTWIAHGSGDADQQTVDLLDHVGVPPDDPHYTLRRVWLSKKEEEGHYSGLSNQGLWPLCHLAFTRPVFDSRHWEMYRRVNQRFAEAVIEEAGDDPAFVFIQDYHFALLPRMLRNASSNLVIAHFWHIPWPNREIFGSFPWREEIVDGLLGNDLLGFHLPEHCENFLDTVDSSLEARISQARDEVCRAGHATRVLPFPISIDFDQHTRFAASGEVAAAMRRWRKDLSLENRILGIGIDRLDYTKGIPERLRAVDLLLEHHPEYRGRLVFAQIAVPSRSGLPAYRQIEHEVDSISAQVNRRWGTLSWRPIVLLKRHYAPADMVALHRLARFCAVTSLHDGMNLVAKEYVASRIEEDGVLVLSEFTGAARELKDALQVNPFAIEQVARAYHMALNMPPDERIYRMQKMRETVRQNNIYRWAGRFISELAKIEVPAYAGTTYSEFDTAGVRFRTTALGVAV